MSRQQSKKAKKIQIDFEIYQTTTSSNIDATTTNNDNDCGNNEYQNTMSKKIEFWQDFKFEKTKQPLKIQIDF